MEILIAKRFLEPVKIVRNEFHQVLNQESQSRFLQELGFSSGISSRILPGIAPVISSKISLDICPGIFPEIPSSI